MSIELTVSFKENVIVGSLNCVVTEIVAGGSVIGYVAINRTYNDNRLVTTITPFTSNGELAESHCPFCAVKALFAQYTGFNLKSVSVAEAEEKPTSHFIGVLTAMLMSKA
ncbi:hypothetical protein A6J71_10255 [Enterobacter cancerogenus]|uniref:hypothetical protein n=1 Tax=Enterobacter cancerogenus TaxID=69218 RepID=UPI000C9BFBC5|nr:hypothetical protein [Enterobacter cancerogenus]PNF10511.1 hypothetical protein A6J71_10255 [Enterobacter cancerogenus]